MYPFIRSHNFLFSLQLIVLIFFIGCSEKEPNLEKKIDLTINKSIDSILLPEHPPENIVIIDTLEQRLIDGGLVDIQKLNANILVDLKYSSEDNFMGKDVYGDLNNAYLQPKVAQSLLECQSFLKSIDSSLTLLVYDAVRPRSVQQYMWDYLDMPIHEKTKFVSNPKNGSIHNYGSAIDITIAHTNGKTLDMGAKYDEIGKIAYPRHELIFLKSGDLSQKQVDNRRLLRKVMKHGHFTNIQTEWWHFNRYSRNKAKTLYQIVE